MKTVLILNESRISSPFTRLTVIGKEALIRAKIPSIDRVILISLPTKNHSLNPLKSIGKTETKVMVIHTIPWPYYLSSVVLFFYGFIACLKYRPSWIEAESPLYSGLSAIILAKIFGLKCIVEIRSDFIDLARFRAPQIPLKLKIIPIKIIQWFVLKQTSAIIANSNYFSRHLIPKITPYLILNPGLSKYNVSFTYAISPKIFTLGFLGRLVPEKGVNVLITALKKLADNPSCPPFHLYIAGKGPEFEKLSLLISALNMKAYITMAGFQNNLSFLSQCHVLINPCLVNAPLEMVNAEAASLGIPVICFGSKDNPETVLDGQTGIKVTSKNPTALSQAILLLLSNESLRRHLHQKGPSFVNSKFNLTSQVNKLQKFYQSLDLV